MPNIIATPLLLILGKIDTEMVRIVTCFFLGAAALAFGLAFGLGTRDIVRNIVTGFYARKILVIGRPLDIAGRNGTSTAITATHAVLEKRWTSHYRGEL